MEKQQAYATLVAHRKACYVCYPELRNPADWPQFDSDEVGPWSLWQGTLDADVMVVGQDWGDTGFFLRHAGNEVGVYNPTNTALRELLASIGIEIDPPSHDGRRGKAFFTNAVLCLKDAKGGLQGPVEKQWFRNCAPFLRCTIEIVQLAAGDAVPVCRAWLHDLSGYPPRPVRRGSGLRCGQRREKIRLGIESANRHSVPLAPLSFLRTIASDDRCRSNLEAIGNADLLEPQLEENAGPCCPFLGRRQSP